MRGSRGVYSVPKTFHKSYFLICVSILLYWTFMSGYIAMNPVFILFPLLITAIFGYFTLKSFYQGIGDYGGYLFFIFIFLGYVINTAVVDANSDNHVWGTWRSIGRFNFSSEEFLSLWIIVVVGSAGLIVGTQAAKKFGLSKFKKEVFHSGFVRSNIGFCLLVWAVFGISIQILMYKFGIGTHTVAASVDLPFKLNGALVFYRDAIHILILGYILSHIDNRRGFKKWYLLLIAVETVIATVTSLSKSAIIFRFAPLILYYFFNRGFSVKRLFLIAIIVVPFFSLLTLVISSLRIGNLSGGEYAVVQESLAGRFDLFDFFTLAMKRVTGAPELMAVVSYPNLSYETLIGFMTGTLSDSIGDLNIAFYGLDLGDKMASKGFTFFAVWYMSGSFLLVFLACSLMAFSVTFLEKLWQSKSLYLLSSFSSVLLAFSFYARGGNRALYSLLLCVVFYFIVRMGARRRSQQ